MVVLPCVFLMASVNDFLCAHGLDFGQNQAKCFQLLFVKNANVA